MIKTTHYYYVSLVNFGQLCCYCLSEMMVKQIIYQKKNCEQELGKQGINLTQ